MGHTTGHAINRSAAKERQGIAPPCHSRSHVGHHGLRQHSVPLCYNVFLMGQEVTLPLYEYRCEKCGSRIEKIQKFSDSPLTTCEKCGGDLTRLLSAPAIQFKGSGFYITDYARKSTSGQKSSSTAKESTSTSGSSTASSKSSDSKASVSS